MAELNNFHYNHRLKYLARELRNNPTKAERRLWYEVLSKKRLLGYSFTRQRPILNYIVDFFCKDLKLIIEVDGASHDFDDAMELDQIRQKNLENLGYQILRFSDWEVLNDFTEVELIIREWIKNNEKNSTP